MKNFHIFGNFIFQTPCKYWSVSPGHFIKHNLYIPRFICCSKAYDVEIDLLQLLHLNFLWQTFAWMCLSKSFVEENILSQVSHLYWFRSSWLLTTCNLSLWALANNSVQIEHLLGEKLIGIILDPLCASCL